MEKFKELGQIFLLSFMFASFFIVGHLVVKVKKLEKNVAILKEGMFGLCDAGDETLKLITNAQDKIVEAFNKIQKLQVEKQKIQIQTQKKLFGI